MTWGEDVGSHTEEGAGRWARAHAEDDSLPYDELDAQDFRPFRTITGPQSVEEMAADLARWARGESCS